MKKDNINKSALDMFDRLTQKIDTLDLENGQLNLFKEIFMIVFKAVESSLNGTIITNNESIITYANPAFMKMFGYINKNNVIGEKIDSLFSDEEVQSASDIATLIDITDEDRQEFNVIHKNGDEFTIEATYSNVLNMDGAVIGAMISFVDISKRKKAELEKNNLIEKLQQALEKVKLLQGFIPICASCKKIRNDEGFWQQVEEYIREHSDAKFTHSFCPDCVEKLYPEIIKKKD